MQRGKQGPANPILAVLGAINWDISIFVDRFARSGEEVPVRLVEEYSGGKGANVAVAAARILGRDKVAFLGALGDDYLWARQLAGLKREGVATEGLAKVEGARSGRAYILVDSDGKKTIHTDFGANDRISPHHLVRGVGASTLSRARMIVVMDPPTPVALTAVQTAGSRGAKVIYSPGVRTEEGLRGMEKVLEHSDYLVLDRSELRNIYRARSDEDSMDALTESHPDLTLIVTLGERGCTVAKRGERTVVGGVDLSSIGKAPVNTTGCGDAFLGVFASYLLLGSKPLEAANWANLAGAMKATRYETRGSPRRQQLENAMRKVEGLRRRQLGLPASRAS